MNNRIGLLSIISIWASVLFLSSSTFCSSSSSLYDKFVQCGVLVHCGKAKVSYPFYLDGSQPSYCGRPGFNVSCSNNTDFPLTISSTFYAHGGPDTTTYDIGPSIENFGFLLLNKAILNIDETCTIPDSKTDVLFTTLVPQSYPNYYLYGGCTKPLPSGLAWSSTPNCSDPILLIPHNDIYSGYAEKECVMRIPLSLALGYGEDMFVPTIGGGRETNWSMYRTVARRGLLIAWDSEFSCYICHGSGGICGYYEDGSKCFCSDGAYPSTCGTGGNSFSIGGLAVIAIIVIIMILWAKKRRENSKIISDLILRKNEATFTLKRYSYWEIKKITGSFKDKLGQGGFGSVYKGVLKEDGRQVAVKILSSSTESNDGQEFINEVASISRTAHVNIVGLIGFCISGSKRALIYPFMPNGSLEKFIYEEKKLSGPPRRPRSLEWGKLHSIAVGIAQGLEYLHRGCTTRILHFDIKPHNILLDGDFCPKISDFGLAKVCKHKESVVSTLVARGTVGYIAPEQVCRNFGRVSHKSDVYSYGMMILEMVGGRKNVDGEKENASEIYFPLWIYKRLLLDQELELNGIVDEDDRVRARKMIITGLWCIQTDPAQRPPIGRVVEMLQGSVESLPVPPKPYMYSPSSSPPHFLAPVFTA
uniref:Protein kinase domain-containing protein n=1 Tax=Kalanchoe fedtschenkoi TaxID=63787 RepID=A0A7N0UPC7_KALFE